MIVDSCNKKLKLEQIKIKRIKMKMKAKMNA